MDRIKECEEYVGRWYMGEPVLTIEMDGGNNYMDEVCIQTMVVALLRDFLENPIPDRLLEGSDGFNSWIDFSFRKVMEGMSFGFSPQQEDQVKNLAFNYWAEGITKTQANPKLKNRIIKMRRYQPSQS